MGKYDQEGGFRWRLEISNIFYFCFNKKLKNLH